MIRVNLSQPRACSSVSYCTVQRRLVHVSQRSTLLRQDQSTSSNPDVSATPVEPRGTSPEDADVHHRFISEYSCFLCPFLRLVRVVQRVESHEASHGCRPRQRRKASADLDDVVTYTFRASRRDTRSASNALHRRQKLNAIANTGSKCLRA